MPEREKRLVSGDNLEKADCVHGLGYDPAPVITVRRKHDSAEAKVGVRLMTPIDFTGAGRLGTRHRNKIGTRRIPTLRLIGAAEDHQGTSIPPYVRPTW